MLNPNNDRLDYGRLLAPPEGYQLDFAIGTTYSLDLDALVGASIALGLSEDTDSSLMSNPICLLEALRTVGDKVALFCEAGRIYLPGKVTELYILLEKTVFQIMPQERRNPAKFPSFHPKFWMLRYKNGTGDVKYRVIVLSRNLTFDRSWDVTFSVDGVVGQQESPKTGPLIDFASYLMKHLPSNENGKTKKKKIKAMMRELPRVQFELDSREFTDFEFLPIGIPGHSVEDEAFDPLFRNTYHELLIMSPFLTASVIKDFNARKLRKENPCMLFTREMSLGKLKQADCTNFRIFTMKDEIVDGESAISEEGANIQKQDIHAKIYLVRKYSDSYLYLGSLNASHNGKKGNIEFMVVLKSKNRNLNVQKLSESFFCGPEDGALNPFQEAKLTETLQDDEQQDLQNALESCVKKVSRMKPEAQVIANGDKYDLNIHFGAYGELAYKVTIAPLLSNKTEVLNENVSFSSLDLTQLSEFYKVSVYSDEMTIERIVIIPTEGIPQDREKTVISRVVKEEGFYKYIAFLLGDDYVLNSLEADRVSEIMGENPSQKREQMPVLYEKMLQTAATNPERLKEIGNLLQTITDDGVVPEHFEELYNTFMKVVKL